MDDQLHAAGFIEKALRHHAVSRWHSAQRRPSCLDILHKLNRAQTIQTALRRAGARAFHILAQARHFARKLLGAPWRLAQPEWNSGSGSMGVLDTYPASLDAADTPGSGAEKEDVAGQAFHGEILVHGPHGSAFRLRHHQVLRGVRKWRRPM